MKKTLVIIAGLLILAWAMGGRPLPFQAPQDAHRANSPTALVDDELTQKSSALQHEEKGAEESATEKDEALMAPATVVSPSSFFPEAKVISSVWIEGKKPDEKILIKTVETDLKVPFVRVEEVYKGEGVDRVMVDQAAMVANQVLLQKPDGISEENFVMGLRSAGAIETKSLKSAVLVTFEARPNEPQALEAYIAKLRQVLGAEVVIEPNYVRKI